MFDIEANSVFEVVPYSQVYGAHPRLFDFVALSAGNVTSLEHESCACEQRVREDWQDRATKLVTSRQKHAIWQAWRTAVTKSLCAESRELCQIRRLDRQRWLRQIRLQGPYPEEAERKARRRAKALIKEIEEIEEEEKEDEEARRRAIQGEELMPTEEP